MVLKVLSAIGMPFQVLISLEQDIAFLLSERADTMHDMCCISFYNKVMKFVLQQLQPPEEKKNKEQCTTTYMIH
jgi:hypothetical protein